MSISKKVFICFLGLLLVFCLAAYNPAIAKSSKIKLKLQSHNIPEDMERALKLFHEIINDLSGGQITVKDFPNSALVPMSEVLEAVGNGTLDMALTADGYWHKLIPVSNFSGGLPFAFQDIQEAIYFMFRKGLVDIVRAEYAKHNVMYLPFEAYNVGIMTNKPIMKAEDLSGMKMRAFGSMAEWLNKMGASTTYIPGSELYTAMATGVVDGAHWGDAGPMFIYKFQEVMKNYMIPEPIIGAWNVILVNMDVWKKMTPEQQAIIEAAVVGGGRFYCFNDMRMRTITSLGKMQRDFDVTVNTLPEAEVIKMRKAAMDVWEKLGAADEPSKKAKDLLYSFLEELGYK